MRKRRPICVTLLGLAGAVSAVALMLHDYVRADVLAGPLPSPRLPRDTIQLTPVEQLGKLMLYDSTLSNPPGYSCAACHVPETGFTGPNSEINAFSGPQPGIVPGRFSNRKPQSYLYAAFSPEGPYYDPGLRTWLGGNFWDGRVPDLAAQGLQPPINPNEMANTPEGPYTPANGGYSPLLVQKLASRPYTAKPNVRPATPLRQYPQYRRSRREKTRSPCTVMRTSASRRTSTTPTISRPTRNPIPTGIIHLGPGTSIMVWVPTLIRRPMEPDSTGMFRATSPSFAASSRRRACAARTSGRRQIS